jgi:MerR family transcriptional regulator, light-induced transcriptional regulator
VPAAGLTIGQVSRLLGVPVPTLRSWELRYDLASPERTVGGHRRYRPHDVEALQALNSAVAKGIAPATAAQSLRAPGPRPDVPLSLLTGVLDAVAAGNQEALLRVLDAGEGQLGVEAAVDRLLVPALREVGRRWELGLLDVGAEHLATAATRRWIARRSGTGPVRTGASPVLLAAAPGNEHTVALEAFGMLLELRRWPVRQLGADSPQEAVLSASRRTGAQAAVLTAHQVSRSRLAIATLRLLAEQTPMSLFYAGAAFDSPRHRLGLPGTYLGTSLPEAADCVESALHQA